MISSTIVLSPSSPSSSMLPPFLKKITLLNRFPSFQWTSGDCSNSHFFWSDCRQCPSSFVHLHLHLHSEMDRDWIHLCFRLFVYIQGNGVGGGHDAQNGCSGWDSRQIVLRNDIGWELWVRVVIRLYLFPLFFLFSLQHLTRRSSLFVDRYSVLDPRL